MAGLRLSLPVIVLATMLVACSSTPSTSESVEPATPTESAMPGTGGNTGCVAGTVFAPATKMSIDSGLARFRVNEVFVAGLRKAEAVGETTQVSGSLDFDSEGMISNQGTPNISVNVATLTTDDTRRDDYLRRNSLEANTFPKANYLVSTIEGAPWPPPTSGTCQLTIKGQMELHGVTRDQDWQATATFDGQQVTMIASTNFRFSDYDMQVPSLSFIAEVEDNIRLELEAALSIALAVN